MVVDHRYTVYVGTYTGQGSRGIYGLRFDPGAGELGPVFLAAETENPSFLEAAPDGRFLYAVNETESFGQQPTGGVSVFAIDPESARLRLLQQVSSLGQGPAHLSLDKSGRYLMVANYDGGNVVVFPVGNDGRLGVRTAFVQHAGSSVHPERQTQPHAHFIQVADDSRFVFVADLGLDQVLVYRLDPTSGTLTPGSPPAANLDPGAGPRHLAFAPAGTWIYVLNELSSTVTVFAYRPGTGMLHRQQTVSTLPKNFSGTNTAAGISVDGSGRCLYVSNRGDDSLVVFRIESGNVNLVPLQRVSCGGKTPRHFTIDPTGAWLLVANQQSHVITLFRIDAGSGRLSPTSRSVKIPSPTCVHVTALK
jgi:6-phosphogluconolactonase